jgi:PAS domain S-box-containing protein
MPADHSEDPFDESEAIPQVSRRFLAALFVAIQQQHISVDQLVGDLPIVIDEQGRVVDPVEWDHFVQFMQRLSRRVGGRRGLEQCGQVLAEQFSARRLSRFAISPASLLRAASSSGLGRALPGIDTKLNRIDETHLELRIAFREGLPPCPEILHVATGCARSVPCLLGLREAVVRASIGEREAEYQIVLPPSLAFFSKIKRFLQSFISAGSALRSLQSQKHELQARIAELQRANEALAQSERRYRTIADTAVDVLCELDETGRILYVSASIRDLIGYSPEQVTGSHYRLWVHKGWHNRIDEIFRCLVSLPGSRTTRECIKLCAAGASHAIAELTARTYETQNGTKRVVCILRSLPEGSIPPDQRPDVLEMDAPDATDWIVDESPEMERLIERAMLQAPPAAFGEDKDEQWVDTRKLLTSIRDAFGEPHEQDTGFVITLRLDSAPKNVWADPALLTTGLKSLVDWTIRQGDPLCPPSVLIEVAQEDASADQPTQVSFRVSALTLSATLAPSAEAELTRETAVASAKEMGGYIERETSSPHPSNRLVLPLPRANPSAL